MVTFRVRMCTEYMVEKAGTKCVKKIIFGLKVGIKSRPSHVRLINNILNGDLIIILSSQQSFKSVENSLSGFLLSSVHNDFLRTFF